MACKNGCLLTTIPPWLIVPASLGCAPFGVSPAGTMYHTWWIGHVSIVRSPEGTAGLQPAVIAAIRPIQTLWPKPRVTLHLARAAKVDLPVAQTVTRTTIVSQERKNVKHQIRNYIVNSICRRFQIFTGTISSSVQLANRRFRSRPIRWFPETLRRPRLRT